MSEDIEKAFKGQAPGYSKHVGYTRYVNGKAIRVEGGAQPHQKVTLAAPGSVKHKGGEFLDRLHSYVHKKAPTTEHELQEAVHRFVHGKFEGDEKALNKFHAEGMKELSRHGLVTHHKIKESNADYYLRTGLPSTTRPKEKSSEKDATPKGNFSPAMLEKLRDSFSGIERVDPESKAYKGVLKLLDTLNPKQLQTIVDAKIKFVSKLARNRLPAEKEEVEKKPRKEAPHPADQELAERKSEKPLTNQQKAKLRAKMWKQSAPSNRELGSTKRVIEEQRKNAAANARIEKMPVKTSNEDQAPLSVKTTEGGWKKLEKNPHGYPRSTKTTPHGQYKIIHQPSGKHLLRYSGDGKNEVEIDVGSHDSEGEAKAAADKHSQTKTSGSEKALPKIPSFEEATHKRLTALAAHPKAKKKAIAALAERIASKPEDATHADLHAEISALEQRHGIDPTEQPEKIGYHEPAVQRAMKKFPSGKALLDATGQESPAHVKANAYEAARRMNEGQKETPSPAKPAPKVEEKKSVASAPQAAQGKGKFIESSVQYLVDNMSESELRSRLPQASDEIKANVNEALRRLAEKKDAKS